MKVKVSKELAEAFSDFKKGSKGLKGSFFERMLKMKMEDNFCYNLKPLNGVSVHTLCEMYINGYEVERTPYERLERIIYNLKGNINEKDGITDAKQIALLTQYVSGLEKGKELWDESKEQPAVSEFPFDDTDELVTDESEGYFISNEQAERIIGYREVITEYTFSAGVRDAKLDTVNHIISLLGIECQKFKKD